MILVRRYQAEEELTLRLVIDASASMGYEEKLETACRLAAMVGYLALAGGDRVQPICLGGAGSCRSVIGPLGRHLSSWPQIERWLERIEPGGAAALEEAAIRTAAPAHARQEVLVSDLLDPGGSRRSTSSAPPVADWCSRCSAGASSIRRWLATSTSSTARPGPAPVLRFGRGTRRISASARGIPRCGGGEGPSLRDGPPGGPGGGRRGSALRQLAGAGVCGEVPGAGGARCGGAGGAARCALHVAEPPAADPRLQRLSLGPSGEPGVVGGPWQRLRPRRFCWPSLPSWRSSPCCWRVPSSSRRPCSDRTPSS